MGILLYIVHSILNVQHITAKLFAGERFLKGEAVVTSKFGPLNDGPDYTVIGSHTGALPQKPALSTRKENYVSDFLV